MGSKALTASDLDTSTAANEAAAVGTPPGKAEVPATSVVPNAKEANPFTQVVKEADEGVAVDKAKKVVVDADKTVRVVACDLIAFCDATSNIRENLAIKVKDQSRVRETCMPARLGSAH